MRLLDETLIKVCRCDVQTSIRVVDELEASEIIAVNIFSEITAAEVPQKRTADVLL